MPTNQVSAEQLLHVVAQLPDRELDTFVARVLELRAQREAPHLPHEESALLLRINHPIPSQLQGRYDALLAKRRTETLTVEEPAELLRLTDQVEQLEADRVTALVELARLRQVPVAEVMRTLEFLSHETCCK
jgi:hypothetical protein